MPDPRQTVPPTPSPISIIEPEPPVTPVSSVVSAEMRDAAARVLARDGRDFVLQPWQVGWLIATSEGREGFVPAGCGVGAGWLQARLDEEMVRQPES